MRKSAAVLLAALLLTGCAAPSEEAASGAMSVSAARAQAAPVKDMRSSLVESAARPLLEAEIFDAYERAQRVYGWFDMAPLPAGDETVLVEEKVYQRVEMEGIYELEDLRTYLRSVFSRELTDRLLDGETARIQYRDVEGALYVSGLARARNAGKGEERVEAEQLDEVSYSVNVMVDLLGEDGETIVGLESWSFPYAFVDDRWVFTDFRLIY